MGKKITLFLLMAAITLSGCAGQFHASLKPDQPLEAEQASEELPVQPSVNPPEQPVATETGANPETPSNNQYESSTDTTPKVNTTSETASEVFDTTLEYYHEALALRQKGDTEKAIELLDQAYALITGADPGDDPVQIQRKEELRINISKRIVEIYASKNVIANGTHTAIPFQINQHIQKEIDLMMGQEKGLFLNAYRRSGKYRPFIVNELKKAGLPEELSWLPLIESSFTLDAFSWARALGLWQFIPSTGYRFGLKRDQYIDERLDPEKATRAAIQYLKELHDIFGEWTTVLAAYNCGENRVLDVIRQQKINYLDHFWDLYEGLPRETARFVPRFLGTIHIVSQPKEYGIDSVELYSPPSYEVVTISKQAHLDDIAKAMDISASTMKELNPELRYQITPPYSYTLRIPVGMSKMFLSVVDTVPSSSLPVSSKESEYKVSKSDSKSNTSKKKASNSSSKKTYASGKSSDIKNKKGDRTQSVKSKLSGKEKVACITKREKINRDSASKEKSKSKNLSSSSKSGRKISKNP